MKLPSSLIPPSTTIFTHFFSGAGGVEKWSFTTIFYRNRKPNWVKWWKTLVKSCLFGCSPYWNDVMKIPLRVCRNIFIRFYSIWFKISFFSRINLRWRIRKVSIAFVASRRGFKHEKFSSLIKDWQISLSRIQLLERVNIEGLPINFFFLS